MSAGIKERLRTMLNESRMIYVDHSVPSEAIAHIIILEAENVRLRKDCRAWSDVATQLCADHCDAAYDLMGKYRKALGEQS